MSETIDFILEQTNLPLKIEYVESVAQHTILTGVASDTLGKNLNYGYTNEKAVELLTKWIRSSKGYIPKAVDNKDTYKTTDVSDILVSFYKFAIATNPINDPTVDCKSVILPMLTASDESSVQIGVALATGLYASIAYTKGEDAGECYDFIKAMSAYASYGSPANADFCRTYALTALALARDGYISKKHLIAVGSESTKYNRCVAYLLENYDSLTEQKYEEYIEHLSNNATYLDTVFLSSLFCVVFTTHSNLNKLKLVQSINILLEKTTAGRHTSLFIFSTLLTLSEHFLYVYGRAVFSKLKYTTDDLT